MKFKPIFQFQPELQNADSPVLEVRNHSLVFRNSIISIDNVSLISTGRLPKINCNPLLFLVTAFFLLLSLALITGIPNRLPLSVLYACYSLALAGIASIAFVYYKNEHRGYHLTVTLNSGNVLSFKSREKPFLDQVLLDLAKCIEKEDVYGNRQYLTVNFQAQNVEVKDYNISDSTFTGSILGGSQNRIENREILS